MLGIIAATKVDTNFGMDFFTKKGFRCQSISITSSPQEQTRLQALDRIQLTNKVLKAANQLIKKEVKTIVIYCNSLSGAIDLEKLRKKTNIKIITPLDVYKKIARKYRIFGILTGNCQSAANIERLILQHNPNAVVIGYGNLELVNEIEKNIAPETIVNKYHIDKIVSIFKDSGCQIIILACTHFPYFYSALKRKTNIQVINPSEEMIKLL